MELRSELGEATTGLEQVLGSARTDPLTGAVRLQWVLESLPGARKIDTRRRLAEMELDPTVTLEVLGEDTVSRLLANFGPGSASQ